MDIRVVVGLNLKRYRLASGISQAEVSLRMGVDRAYVSLIERGRQNVTITTLNELARALEVRSCDLLCEDGARLVIDT